MATSMVSGGPTSVRPATVQGCRPRKASRMSVLPVCGPRRVISSKL